MLPTRNPLQETPAVAVPVSVPVEFRCLNEIEGDGHDLEVRQAMQLVRLGQPISIPIYPETQIRPSSVPGGEPSVFVASEKPVVEFTQGLETVSCSRSISQPRRITEKLTAIGH